MCSGCGCWLESPVRLLSVAAWKVLEGPGRFWMVLGGFVHRSGVWVLLVAALSQGLALASPSYGIRKGRLLKESKVQAAGSLGSALGATQFHVCPIY